MEIRPGNLREASREMESVFVGQMFDAMRRTTGGAKGLFAQSGPEKMFQQMFDQEVARSLAQGQGLGIGDIIEQQLSEGKETE